MPNGNGADTAPPWYYKPVLGPLTPSDILAIAGTSLSPLHMGYYKPFLPLGLTGQVLLGKEEQYQQQALEQQQREPLAQAAGPLWQARYGTAAPPEVTRAIRESPEGAKFVEPYLKPVAPARGSYTPVDQAAWISEVEALPEGTIDPNFKQALTAMGPVQGRSALRAMAPNYIPATPEVQKQRMQTRVEPVQVRIGGQKEVAELQHGYRGEEISQKGVLKSEEIAQQAQAHLEQFQKEQEAAGPRERVKAEGKIVAEDEKTMALADQGIANVQRLRDIAANVTTGVIAGGDFFTKVRSLFGDADINLFDQLLKQAALPNIKPLLGGNAISDADRLAVLDMMAGRAVPQEANLKSIDAVMQGLNATKNLIAARTQYFDEKGTFKGFGKEEQVPGGPKVRYIGVREGFPIYEDFATGIRFTKDPSGKWVGWEGS